MAHGPVGDWLARALGWPELRRSIRRSAAGGAMMVAAAVAFVAGIGLLIAALTVWIARDLGASAALSIVGGALVAIAAVAVLANRARTPARPDPTLAPGAIAGAQGSPLAAVVATIIADLLRDKALLPMAVAAAGLLAALAVRKPPDNPTPPR